MSKPALPEWFLNLLSLHSFVSEYYLTDDDGPGYSVMCAKCGGLVSNLLHPDYSQWRRETWIDCYASHSRLHKCAR